MLESAPNQSRHAHSPFATSGFCFSGAFGLLGLLRRLWLLRVPLLPKLRHGLAGEAASGFGVLGAEAFELGEGAEEFDVLRVWREDGGS